MSLFCSCVSSSFHPRLLLLFEGFVFQTSLYLCLRDPLSFLSLSISFCVHSCLSSLASQLEEHQRKRSKRENLSIHFLTSSVSPVVRMQVLPPLVFSCLLSMSRGSFFCPVVFTDECPAVFLSHVSPGIHHESLFSESLIRVHLLSHFTNW